MPGTARHPDEQGLDDPDQTRLKSASPETIADFGAVTYVLGWLP